MCRALNDNQYTSAYIIQYDILTRGSSAFTAGRRDVRGAAAGAAGRRCARLPAVLGLRDVVAAAGAAAAPHRGGRGRHRARDGQPARGQHRFSNR